MDEDIPPDFWLPEAHFSLLFHMIHEKKSIEKWGKAKENLRQKEKPAILTE